MRLALLDSLKACAHKKDLYQGSRIHADIRASGLLEKDPCLGNALINMYAKCGAFARAQQVADELPGRNVVSWTALIAGYAQHGQALEALCCFQRMWSHGVSPNAITYACVLKACGSAQDMVMGKQIHEEILCQGLLKRDAVLGGALVDMYAKCGALLRARQVFDMLPVRSSVSWNALMAGYAHHGQGQEVLSCFQQMRSHGFLPDAVTYACTLKACGILQDVGTGKQIHDDIISQGLLKQDVVLGNALVDMYARCGVLLRAQEVFDMLPVKNVSSWNALIGGYAQQGQGHEALGCFEQMRSQGRRVSPDAITYVCALKACGMVEDPDTGKQIHDDIISQGLLKKEVVLGGALVDMYAKCGALLKARQVLDMLPVRSVVSWNALIAGYVQHGQGQEAVDCLRLMRSEGFSPNLRSWTLLIGWYAQQGLAMEALDCFGCMEKEGIAPDPIMFLNVLNACSHSGLIDEGRALFNTMREKYGIVPTVEHYACMVDLFGRARLFEEAMRVIGMMGSSNHLLVWSALLSACRRWGNVKLGRLAFERAIQLDRSDAAPYVIMSNIYAAAGMQREVDSVEGMRRNACI